MGLRERVALLIIVVFLVQLMYIQCVPRPKKVKTTYEVSHKPRRSKKHGKAVQQSIKTNDDTVKRFNFPEVEYSAPMSQLSSLFSNQNFDLQCGQVSPSPQGVSKSDMRLTNKSKKRKLKMNRKKDRADSLSLKISQFPSFPEIETFPNPLCLNYKDVFPSVDYPLDASELWTPYYWNSIPQIQPELQFNVKDMSINTKATEEISKYPIGPEKKAAAKKILNSVINSETKYKGKKECYSHLNNGEQHKISVNHDSTNETRPIAITGNDIERNSDDLNNPVYLTRTNKLSFDESITNSVLMTVTTSPITIVTPTYDNEPVTSTVPKFISPLTTLSPIDEKICYSKDIVNPPVKDTEENEVLADDMGYTLMYPEVFNYLSTSTPPSLLTDNVDMWMYPELDNHTLNTYSDEVDQCYILVT